MNSWTTYGLPGVFALLAAVILFGRARPARLPAVFLSLIAAILMLIAVFPGLEEAFLPNKIRLFMGGISLLHLFITLETVRRNTLKERYALLWIGTGLVLLFFAVYPDGIEWLVQVTGMHYTSAIIIVVFTFLILIAFHVSLVLSKNEHDRRRLSQSLALLEARVRDLENRKDPL